MKKENKTIELNIISFEDGTVTSTSYINKETIEKGPESNPLFTRPLPKGYEIRDELNRVVLRGKVEDLLGKNE